MLNKVKQYIAKRALLTPEKGYLVALSGGADSVALLLILKNLDYRIEAAHCNFNLRGADSDEDEKFCINLCHAHNIPLHRAHFDTRFYAKQHGISIEMAARTLRYNYFQQLLTDLQLHAVCVAHHSNDNVETLLLNLIRGTGIEGLKGILPKNGRVVRPLLCVTRADIEEYLHTHKQDYRTDITNFEDNYTRNKIRLNILPTLREVNPAVDAHINNTAVRVEQALDILQIAISEAIKRVSVPTTNGYIISIDSLLGETSPELILWEMLKEQSFTSSQVEQIFNNIHANSGREWTSATHSLITNRGNLIIEKLQSSMPTLIIPEHDVYNYTDDVKFRVELHKTHTHDSDCDNEDNKTTKETIISKDANCATLDASNIKFPLTIRTIKDGDSFIPFGMNGRKLISDFLTDRKLTVFEKRRQLVITDATGNILWLVGVRTDNRYKVSSTTTNILRISKE